MDDFMMCPADVRVLLHEGGNLRENEKQYG